MGTGSGGRGQGGWIRIAWLWALSLTLTSLLLGGCAPQAGPPSSRALPVVPPAGRLQEVAPPGAVAQIEAALAHHRPHLSITAPAEGALLAAGPWQLALVLEDWPLSQDPSLGLGPHLVVQVDDGPGLRIGGWSQGDAGSGRLDLEMAELAPGSHRITAYAALPWGEAVKLPGASAQRRVHRVAANPVTQPAAGSAQLVAASPDGLSRSEPVLIDWLLRDAPLQGLREGDARWRLRITVNGDSFLVDQNTPIWLRGLRPGSNSLLLELLDGLGEPLNPPFNSLVREVVIEPGAARPAWLGERISPAELARLLGESSPQTPTEDGTSEAAGGAETAPEGPASLGPSSAADPRRAAAELQAAGGDGRLEVETKRGPAPAPGESQAAPSATVAPLPAQVASPASTQAPAPEAVQEPATEAAPAPADAASGAPGDATEDGSTSPAPEPGPSPDSAAEALSASDLKADAPPAGDGEPRTRANPGASARELVREDGSLIQPLQSSPLGGLAARLRP